jgi:hypothetical protein
MAPVFAIARVGEHSMLRSKLLSFVIVPALLAAGQAGGATPIKIVGFEDMSCQAWSKSKDDREQRDLYVAWIRGVLTGHNYASQSQQVSAISNGTVEMFVNRYCAEKPLSQMDLAAFRMSDQFSGRNAPISK